MERGFCIYLFLGHLKTSGDLLLSTFVRRRASCVMRRLVARYLFLYINIFYFSSETTGHILIKLRHNDHLVMRIKIYIWKKYCPQRAEGQGQMGSNSAKSTSNFSSEATCQIMMKLGHNEHLDSNGY